MGLIEDIRFAAQQAAGRMASALGAFAQAAPIVPGVGRQNIAPYRLPQDLNAQRTAESREALFGRISTSLGPVQNNISTHPLRRLTPARISQIKEEVLVTGWMLNWACLVEDVHLVDSQIATLQKSGAEAVTGAPFTVEPAAASDENEAIAAQAIADYQQAVIDQIDCWDSAMEALLIGNASGYALQEAVYAEREIRVPFGKSTLQVNAITPVSFEEVHQKHTRWNLGAGNQLELDTGGQFIKPPGIKYITYETSGPFAVRRRGYMYQAVPLAMIKLAAWARWGATLETWGVRSPYGVADRALWQDKTRRAEMLQALQRLGLGEPAAFTDDFKIEAGPSVTDGDTRGMHAAVISAVNIEESKLILGSILTTEVSGTGSYNASDTHADSKQARILNWERGISNAVRAWMRFALQLACYRVNEDGTLGDVNPTGLSAKLGLTPERVMALCGRPSWRVQREATPSVRMDLYDRAVNKLGLAIDQDATYREFGFPRARSANKALKGEAILLAADGASTSTTDALQGKENPKEEQSKAPPKSRQRRSRAKGQKDS